jgi:peptide/nickel transport system substrate-binding protein
VLARDCTASLRRWMKRDPAGATLQARLDAMEAPDDRTIVLRLKKAPVAAALMLSKFQTAAVMVPKRLADGTDPFKQMPETIGSGPFRFLKDEYVIGSHAAMVPFERYVPRNEPASFTSGGHRVLVDRMEWKMIPDAATAANALVTGEVDWLEMPLPDLLPMLKRAPNVVTGRIDDWGFISQLRPNHLNPPTSDAAVPASDAGRDRPAGGDGGDDGQTTPPA